MTPTHIVNQDRDRIYPIGASFYPVQVVSDGDLMGFNLMMDKIPLGTFDSPVEAVREITNILNSKSQVPFVSGYSAGGFASIQIWD